MKFSSAAAYGLDLIIRNALAADEHLQLPITIPHGIDFYALKTDLDLHCHEPIYMAFREDVAERVSRIKDVIRFPHPWLFLAQEASKSLGTGTLFIAPPPSARNFEATFRAIQTGEYAKPWGILIKNRGAQTSDFEWWTDRGFTAYTAGVSSDANFFYNLRNIFSHYASVASPNMSSAVIFAVAMNRRAFALPDVWLEYVDDPTFNETTVLNDSDGRIAQVWRNLISTDLQVARRQAEALLGYKYMATPVELRARVEQCTKRIRKRPIHLYPLQTTGILYRVVIFAIALGIPIQKLFPSPIAKMRRVVLTWLRRNKLAVIYWSDFANYRVVGEYKPPRVWLVEARTLGQSAVPGYAVRSELGTAQPQAQSN